jgi:hypothetical protein
MSSPGLIGYVLAGYFVVLVGLSLARAVPVRFAAIQRLRAFFPSWKFFDEVGVVPLLLARVAADEDALAAGAWRPCLGPLPRRAGAILVNPAATLQLAYGSLLAQLVAEVEDLPAPADVEALPAYQMTLALVRTRLAAPAGQCLQFKICLCAPGASPRGDDDMIISPVYAA